MARKIADLFFEIRGRTEGLQTDLDQSQRHLTRFTEYVTANPTAALAALGVAAAGAAAKVLSMAAEFDQGMRQIAAALPQGMDGMKDLGHEIEQVAIRSGRATSEILAHAQQIARLGVSGPAELKQRLEAATLIADATGTEMGTVISGLDQVMDAFGVSADEAKRALADMFVANRGRGDFDALFQSFQTVTAQAQEMGLTLHETTGALVVLLDRGLSARNIKTFFGEHTVEQIRELASQARSATDSIEQLEQAASITREGAQRLNQALRDELNAALIDLGNQGLPLANKGLQALVELLNPAAVAARQLSRDLEALKRSPFEDPLKAQKGGYLPKEFNTHDRITRLSVGFGEHGAELFGGMDVAELRRLRKNITTARGMDPSLQVKAVSDLLEGINTQLVTLGAAAADAQAKQHGKPPSKEDLAKVQAFRDDIASAIAAFTPGKGDDIRAKAAGYARRAGELKMDPGEAAALVARYREMAEGAAKDEKLTKALAPVVQALDAGLTRAMKQIRPFDDPELQQESERIAAEITTTLVDDMQVKLAQDLGKMFHDGIPEAVRQGYATHQGALITVQGTKETVDDRLAKLDAMPGDLNKMKELRDLDEELVKAGEKLDQLGGDRNAKADAYRVLAGLALKIEQRRAQVVKDHSDSTTAATKSLRQHTAELAGTIANAADFAYGLAQAFGQADTEVGQLLASVGQLAHGVEKLAEGKILEGGVQTAAALFSIGKKLFGGESSADRRQREQAQLATSRLIDALTIDLRGGGQSLEARIKAVQEKYADARQQVEEQLAGKKNQNTREQRLRELGLMQPEAVAKAKADFAEEMKQRQQDYEVRRLRATGHDDEAEAKARAEAAQRELSEAEKNGADDATLLALQLAQTAEAAKAAADAEAKLRDKRLERANQELEIFDITDPGQQLAKRAEVFQSFGGSLAELFKGLDLTNPADVATLDQRVRDLFTQLETAPDSVDLAGLSIDELINVLLQLDGAADQVASGVKTAAQAFQDSVAKLNTDLEVYNVTDPVERAKKIAELYGSQGGIGDALKGFDLSTEEGRKAAEKALQGLYGGGSDAATTDAILAVLRALRGVPGATPLDSASGAGDARASGGSRESIANAAMGLTQAVGSRMADYLASINIGIRELPDALAQELAAWLTPVITGPVFPPALPSSWAQAGGATRSTAAGDGGLHVTVQVIVQVDGAALDSPAQFGDTLGQSVAQQVNKEFVDWYRTAQKRNGNLDRPGVS